MNPATGSTESSVWWDLKIIVITIIIIIIITAIKHKFTKRWSKERLSED